MAKELGAASAASIKAYAVKARDDAKILKEEQEVNELTAKRLAYAANFLEIVDTLETVNIKHDDALMIATLIQKKEEREKPSTLTTSSGISASSIGFNPR